MTSARGEHTGPTLCLIPTELELRRLSDAGGLERARVLISSCGFGPVAAAARTAELLERLKPRRVLLLGVAGTYDDGQDEVGCARLFRRVAVEGIGAGEGLELEGPPALGFPQWPGPTPSGKVIEDELPLWTPAGRSLPVADLLLTTCAASASPEQAALRLQRHPGAVAEDMEGFSVACACAMRGVPLAIVRGISNRVGDRDPKSWRIPAALHAARELALELCADDSPWNPGEVDA